jgi:flagellar basal-body rod protein FlgF
MSEGGGPIAIPADAGQITVTPKGDVATEQGLLGRLKVVTFEDPQGLKPVGDNLYDAGDMAEKPVEDPRVQQGMIEGSNVNPIVEMNRMVEVLRMYQATQRMLLADHDRIRTAIQKLAKA